MFTALHYGVLFSGLLAVISLTWLVISTFRFGKKPLYAKETDQQDGSLRYMFGRGMLPWEKESAILHPVTYTAGIIYHLGTFAALAYLIVRLSGWVAPVPATWTIRALMLAGLICGLGLLLKRARSPLMGPISNLDDYLSNLFVDSFILLAVLDSFSGSFQPAFYVSAIILFLYMPVGKIRHCVFFFYSRILLGSFLGRRGAIPQQPK
jgi:hypothetical protein